MGFQGDMAREGLVHRLCTEFTNKITQNQDKPEVLKVLNELGVYALKELDNIPEWAWEYYKLFGVDFDKVFSTDDPSVD